MFLTDFVAKLAHFPVGSPIASVNFVAELAHFPICPLVAPIGMVVYKIDSIEDDVIMAMPLVDVGGDHIFILAFQPFVGKLFSDFMRHLRRDFSDVEGLNQVSGNHLRHLHSLLGSEVACPLKFLCRRVAGCTAERGNIELIVSLFRVEDEASALFTVPRIGLILVTAIFPFASLSAR